MPCIERTQKPTEENCLETQMFTFKKQNEPGEQSALRIHALLDLHHESVLNVVVNHPRVQRAGAMPDRTLILIGTGRCKTVLVERVKVPQRQTVTGERREAQTRKQVKWQTQQLRRR